MALEDRNVAAEHCKEEQYPFQPDKFLKEANSECQEKKVLPQSSDESDREELITDFQTGKWWIITLITLNYLEESSNWV